MEESPLKSTCTISMQELDDSSQQMLRSWQLNLTPDVPSYLIPSELPSTLMAVAWSGSVTVSESVDASCDGDNAGRWIGELLPGATIELSGDEPAEIALFGVFASALPQFEPSSALSSKNALSFGEITKDVTIAIIRILDVSDVPARPEPWGRPAIILRSSNGPTPKTSKELPHEVEDQPEEGEESGPTSRLTIRGIAERLFLEFVNDQSETEVIVCDIDLSSDVDVLEGCIWRCRG